MVDSANVVTGFEFPRVKSLGESAEARRRGNFVASLENIFECDRLVLDSPSCYAALGVKVTS